MAAVVRSTRLTVHHTFYTIMDPVLNMIDCLVMFFLVADRNPVTGAGVQLPPSPNPKTAARGLFRKITLMFIVCN